MMKKFMLFLVFTTLNSLMAQGEKVETVYFEFDKFTMDQYQENKILEFVKKADTSKIESIQIYGYCDDRGGNEYNYKLSENRVSTVRTLLTNNGFNKNKIVIIEGRGRVIIKNDEVENLMDVRTKNRRVDLLIVKKNTFGKGIYSNIQEKHSIGDRIYFEKIYFALGSSVISKQAEEELDKIVVILQKKPTLDFEIRGHVCCTPSYYDDAIDKKTRERKLSVNRAKAVFRYLISKHINSLRMSYRGSGNKFPLGMGEALDRRVEFVITKI
jgi:outer membrane protein OmpA-like peptidoglycan-associated protein